MLYDSTSSRISTKVDSGVYEQYKDNSFMTRAEQWFMPWGGNMFIVIEEIERSLKLEFNG